jgi:hypothetical protein
MQTGGTGGCAGVSPVDGTGDHRGRRATLIDHQTMAGGGDGDGVASERTDWGTKTRTVPGFVAMAPAVLPEVTGFCKRTLPSSAVALRHPRAQTRRLRERNGVVCADLVED